MSWIDTLLTTGLIPQWLIRYGIRQLLHRKLKTESCMSEAMQQEKLMAFIADLKQSPIAIETDSANQQHYEVPSGFFQAVLGPRCKYSSGYWAEGVTTLKQAEETMLALTCQRADIQEGQRILDLGCGWGSLSLWLAEKYPQAQITGLSNSSTQKTFILSQAKAKGFTNLEIVTGNITEVILNQQFDRIVSIEMFEHMKNYEALLAKIRPWLNTQGKLFIHIFTHRRFAYHYEDAGPSDWLTRYFFAGGTMPSNDLLLYFQNEFRIQQHWIVDGWHYQKTAEAWLENMKKNRAIIWPILSETYGAKQTQKWWVYWQVFLMACAELWGFRHGQEWIVSHYLFEPS